MGGSTVITNNNNNIGSSGTVITTNRVGNQVETIINDGSQIIGQKGNKFLLSNGDTVNISPIITQPSLSGGVIVTNNNKNGLKETIIQSVNSAGIPITNRVLTLNNNPLIIDRPILSGISAPSVFSFVSDGNSHVVTNNNIFGNSAISNNNFVGASRSGTFIVNNNSN